MSVTNAISGIIIVGALIGLRDADQSITVAILSITGILLASINVFGGFTVTQRMLGMFKRS
jgi:NAD(P) transhydrogenase subunit alpha